MLVKPICACEGCAIYVEKRNKKAYDFWMSILKMGKEYIRAVDPSEQIAPPEAYGPWLEHHGFILTTECSLNNLKIKILGLDCEAWHVCVKKCLMDK